MAHKILYEHIGDDDEFSMFRVVWEPITEHVALYCRNDNEYLNGMVRPLPQMIEYFDRRAVAGAPWNGRVARLARRQLAHLIGEEAPPDPLDSPEEQAQLRKIG
jgi:hypothetical protein